MEKIIFRYTQILLIGLIGLMLSCTKSKETTPAPTVDFTFLPASPSTKDTIRFTSTTLNAKTYAWSSNPVGLISTAQNPKQVLATAGTYAITLTATGDGGSTTVTKSVTVVAPVPTADFTFAPATPVVGQVVTFTSVVQNATTYAWSSVPVGFTSTAQNPTFTFLTAGVYQVTLKATGAGGDFSVNKSVTVGALMPTPNFTFAPVSPTVGQVVTFTNTSTDATTYEWSSTTSTFTSTQQNPTFAFPTAGVQQITLKATGAGGSMTVNKSITVVASLLTANFTFLPVNPQTGQLVTFANTSVSAKTYEWTSTPTGFSSTVKNPTFTFTNANTYQVKLTVKDTFGNMASVTKDVIVTPGAITLPTTIADTVNTKISGILQAMRVKVGAVSTDMGTGLFYTAPGSFTFIDGGAVKANNQTLTKNANNTYSAIGALGGFALNGNVSWNVVGNANVPAIDFNTNKAIPTTPDVVAFPSSLNKATGFTIQLSAPVTSDYLFVTVAGINASNQTVGTISKSFPVNSTSLVISAADIANIDTAKGFVITVGAMTYTFKDFGGKVFLFSNLAINSATVAQ